MNNKPLNNKKETLENLENTTETNNAAEMDLKMKKVQFTKGSQYYSCIECEFSAPKSKVKWHKESKHIGISYSCDKCDSKQSSKFS